MMVAGSFKLSTNPNEITERPINVKPNPSKFGYPKHSIMRPIWGEKMIRATEKAAKTNPTYSPLMFF